jgi:hypothetical protein
VGEGEKGRGGEWDDLDDWTTGTTGRGGDLDTRRLGDWETGRFGVSVRWTFEFHRADLCDLCGRNEGVKFLIFYYLEIVVKLYPILLRFLF